MTGDAQSAHDAFQNAVREAAHRSAQTEIADGRLALFRTARRLCLTANANPPRTEPHVAGEEELPENIEALISRIEPAQFAAWISAAPEPQRTALALYFLDSFSHAEVAELVEVTPRELAALVGDGRRQLQSWLETVPALAVS